MTTNPSPGIPLIGILTPVFNEEDNLETYVAEVKRVLLDQTEFDVRVILVDDGSTDASWKMIEKLADEDSRFRGIRLSRNFGSHVALSAGLMNLDEAFDACATLACDLQDPPELIVEFVRQWRAGADIVWGERHLRRDARWRVATSRLFHAALGRWAMPKGSRFTTGSFLLMDRRVIRAVQEMPEHNRITFALVGWTGFDQVRVEYDRRERRAGKSGWNFSLMVKTMYDAFVGFSTLPIRLMKRAALTAFSTAVGLTIYLLVVAVKGAKVPGWTSQMLVLSVFFAVQFSLMAIMGEYLYRIYSEAVRRPLYFVAADTAARSVLDDRGR